MIKVLITGQNSYIGTSFENYIKKDPNIQIKTLDMLDDNWYDYDFSQFDSIYHVAGIAHSDTGKVSKERRELYHKVNCDLAIEVAKKAKDSGVKHFVFMSSMIIYGEDAPIGKVKEIRKDTVPNPANFYGQSKLDGDIGIQKLADEQFKIAIIRTPMVYGPSCKGNFPRLVKLAMKLPFFPKIENKRSMIYIDNLTEFIKIIIQKKLNGIFYPQNDELVSTSAIIKAVRTYYGKKTHFIIILNPFVKLASKFLKIINKAYGSKIYDEDTKSNIKYNIINFHDSVVRTLEKK